MRKVKLNYQKINKVLQRLEKVETKKCDIEVIGGIQYSVPMDIGNMISGMASEQQLYELITYMEIVEEEGEDTSGEYWGYREVFEWCDMMKMQILHASALE